MDIESGSLGAAIGVVATALSGAAVKVFGSRKERDASSQSAADEWQELHAECRRECAEMRATMSGLRDSITALEDRARLEHAPCEAEINRLKKRVHGIRKAVNLLRDSTPPHSAYTPDDVRRALLEDSDG